MIKPVFNVLIAHQEDNYTEFVLEPLERGYGHTVGNALRRVLLSSIEGHAITAVKIKGVDHEFQTVKGMTEDVVELLLNLKEIRIKSDLTDPVHLSLKKKGGMVTAGDIECPGSVEIVNPSQHLATLAEGATLELELTVEHGVGFSPANERESEDLSGELMVDAIYSPVTKVAYSVEETRVGRRTDFDKLILKMWTDGTVDAREVLDQSAEILISHFQQVINPTDIVQKTTEVVSQPQNETNRLTIEELELPTRIANALRKAGYNTVGDLAKVTKSQAALVKNLGDKSVDMVEEALQKVSAGFKAETQSEEAEK
jgi:DNA-directed RNA polymerase subunit alpha